jgi:hypothetical protein
LQNEQEEKIAGIEEETRKRHEIFTTLNKYCWI